MISKNEKILKRWYDLAYEKAKNNGLNRIINHDNLLNYLMSGCAFTTQNEDKENVIEIIYNILMDLEKLCKCIESENLSENIVKRACDFIV